MRDLKRLSKIKLDSAKNVKPEVKNVEDSKNSSTTPENCQKEKGNNDTEEKSNNDDDSLNVSINSYSSLAQDTPKIVEPDNNLSTWISFLSEEPDGEDQDAKGTDGEDVSSIYSNDSGQDSNTRSLSQSSASLSPYQRKPRGQMGRKKSMRLGRKKKATAEGTSLTSSKGEENKRSSLSSPSINSMFSTLRNRSFSPSAEKNTQLHQAISMPCLMELSFSDEQLSPRHLRDNQDNDNYDEDIDILLSESGKEVLNSITMEKLMDRIFGQLSYDVEEFNVFLLTFRHVISPVQLLNNIIERFKIVDFDENNTDTILQPNVPQLRCTNFVVKWMEKMFFDFAYDVNVKEKLSELQGLSEKYKLTYITNRIETTKIAEGKNWKELMSQPLPFVLSAKSNKDIMETATFDFLEIKNEVLAEQLTLIDSELYKSMRKEEIMMHMWGKKHEKYDDIIPRFEGYVQWFNKITKWASTEILLSPDLKKRTNTLKKMIGLALRFKKLKSFNCMYACYCAMNNGSVSRLAKTWENVPKDDRIKYKEVEQICNASRNYSYYRVLMKTMSVPAIPIFAIVLRDMTYLNEMDKYLENGHIHFFKLAVFYRKIEVISAFQQSVFNFKADENILKACQNLTVFDEETLYDLSYTYEPRRASSKSSRGSLSSQHNNDTKIIPHSARSSVNESKTEIVSDEQ